MLANTDLNNEVFEIIGSLSAEDGVAEQLLKLEIFTYLEKNLHNPRCLWILSNIAADSE